MEAKVQIISRVDSICSKCPHYPSHGYQSLPSFGKTADYHVTLPPPSGGTNHRTPKPQEFPRGRDQTQAGPIIIPKSHLAIVTDLRVGKTPSLGFSQLDLGESSFLSDGKAEKM